MRMTALSKVSVTNPYPTGGLLRVLVSTDSSIPGATGLFNFRQSEGPQQYHTVLFTHVHGGVCLEALYSAILVSFFCLCIIIIARE